MSVARAKEITGKCLQHKCRALSSDPQDPQRACCGSASVSPSTPWRWKAKRLGQLAWQMQQQTKGKMTGLHTRAVTYTPALTVLD